MINAVNNTSAETSVGAVARPHVQEAAPRPAPVAQHRAPSPAPAPAPAPDSTRVTISQRGHASAQADVAARTARGLATGARDLAANANASANAQAEKTAVAEANSHALAPQHEARVGPAPAPLNLDPLPLKHVPTIAYSPADGNEDGHVTTNEREDYDFHHPPSLAAEPGPDLSAYTSIAGS